MYTEYYRLRKRPFENIADPDFLFLSKSHREVLAALNYAVNEAKGFVCVIGDPGTGKTLLINALIKQMSPSFVFLNVGNPRVTFRDTLDFLARRFGIATEELGTLDLIECVKQRLEALCENEKKQAVLIIDEAHLLSEKALEDIRLVSNIENEKRKFIQIILVGQDSLTEKLARESLRALKQRLVITRRLLPLDRKETLEYIRHRLSIAGRKAPLFSNRALALVWKKTRGIPRLINQICDNALLIGYAIEARSIHPKIIREVIQDMESVDSLEKNWAHSFFRLKWMGAVCVLILLGIGYMIWELPTRNTASLNTAISKRGPIPAQKHLPSGSRGLSSTRISDSARGSSSNLPVTDSSLTNDRESLSPKKTDETPAAIPPVSGRVVFPITEKPAIPEKRPGPDRETANSETPPARQHETGDLYVPDSPAISRVTPADEMEAEQEEMPSGQGLPSVPSRETTLGTGRTITSPLLDESREMETPYPPKEEGDSSPKDLPLKMAPIKLLERSANTPPVTVEKGEWLYRMAKREYGIGNPSIIDLIQMVNPQIEDVNRVFPNQDVILPDVQKEDLVIREGEGAYYIYYASFNNLGDAKASVRDLVQDGKSASISVVHEGERGVYRIYIGPFSDRDELESFLNRMDFKYLPFLNS